MGGKRDRKKLKKQEVNASRKKVVAPAPRSQGKSVPDGATQTGSYRDQRVEWTVREMDTLPCVEDGRRWSLEAEEARQIFVFLEELGKKTWGEWMGERQGGRPKHHDHEVSSLGKVAQRRLAELPAAEERIFRFRLSGPGRLWGFRSGHLFRVLWWDPDHRVYEVEKKHT